MPTLEGEREEFAEGQLSKGVGVHESVACGQTNQLFPVSSAQSRVREIIEQLSADLVDETTATFFLEGDEDLL